MLDTPKYGWSRITIGSWSDRCSDLNDVPFMLLEALEQSCREHKPIAAKFDAEGWEYTIVFDWFETHIISDKDEYIYTTIEVNRDDLARELIADIRKDIDLWSCWDYYGCMTDDQKSERKKDLLVLCDILERRLPSNDWTLIYKKENEDYE